MLLMSYIHSASAFLVRTDACLRVLMKKIIIAILEYVQFLFFVFLNEWYTEAAAN